MKQKFFLVHATARQRAVDAVKAAPEGYEVTIQAPTRSTEQNSKLWPMLMDLSTQIQWPVDGVLRSIEPEVWKDIFTAALCRHQCMAKGIDGGVVMVGGRTRLMKKQEMSDLIELMYAFGAEHGVIWTEIKNG